MSTCICVQIGTLLLSANQSIKTSQPLDQQKHSILEKHGITTYRRSEPCVVESDIHKILPVCPRGWMDGWMDHWMIERMEGGIEEREA